MSGPATSNLSQASSSTLAGPSTTATSSATLPATAITTTTTTPSGPLPPSLLALLSDPILNPHTTTASAITHLPPPQPFDFLPPLHSLIQSLLLSSSSQNLNTTTTATNTTTATTTISTTDLDLPSISHTTNPLRIQLQKARALVQGLPDINKSIEEQEVEIRELEERLRRGREVVGRILGVGAEVGAEYGAGGEGGSGDSAEKGDGAGSTNMELDA